MRPVSNLPVMASTRIDRARARMPRARRA
jgi:hypothetical protein